MPRGPTTANRNADQELRALVREAVAAPNETRRREVFDRLWGQVAGRVRGKLRRDWCKQYPDGNDFVDEVAALVPRKLWEGGLAGYRGECSVLSYVHRIAKTSAIDEHRRRRRKLEDQLADGSRTGSEATEDDDPWARLGAREESTPESALLREEQLQRDHEREREMARRVEEAARRLYDALRTLSTRTRQTAKWAQALRLRYFESETHPTIDDVAATMGVSWRSAHRYLGDGLEALAQALEGLGVEDLDALCRWAAGHPDRSGARDPRGGH